MKRSLPMPVRQEEVSDYDINIIAETVFEEAGGEPSYVEKKFPCIDLLISKSVTGELIFVQFFIALFCCFIQKTTQSSFTNSSMYLQGKGYLVHFLWEYTSSF